LLSAYLPRLLLSLSPDPHSNPLPGQGEKGEDGSGKKTTKLNAFVLEAKD